MNEETLRKWVEARTLGNGLYSIYKDVRTQETTYQSMLTEQLRHRHGLEDDKIIGVIKTINRTIDGAAKNVPNSNDTIIHSDNVAGGDLDF